MPDRQPSSSTCRLRRTSPVAVLLSLLVTAPLMAQSSTAIEQWEPARLEPTVLASGLMRPMEIEVDKAGTVWFIELEGQLKKLSPQSGEITLVGEVKVTTDQENGLIGMALDPDFARTNWIYLQYSPPDYEGQYISRFTLVDGLLDLSTEKRLFQYKEQRKTCCHHAGSLEFGPDGCLFISSGDNTNPFEDSQGFAPIDERPGREPWDAQGTSANSRSGNGKVLRIRPLPDGSVEIPDGNLFPRDGSQGMPEIYVMGCRNPWRISVDQRTGFLYWGDVGPDAGGNTARGPRGHDEINQARQAGFFGWPYFNANNKPYADVNFETGEIGALFDAEHPLNDSVNNTGIRELPPAQPALIFYPGGPSEEFPELGQGGRTACAGPVFYYDAETSSELGLPEGLHGAMFIFEWSRHWIKLVHFDKQHNVAAIQPFMPDYPFRRPIDIAVGPHGSLYILEYGETWGVNQDAKLVRVDYVRGNRTPTAVASATGNIGRHPLTVSLSAKGSADRDLDPLTYEWRLIDTLNPAAQPRTLARTADAEVIIESPGIFNVELVVTDPSGASRTAAVPVLSGNAPAEIRFARLQDGDFFESDRPIGYELIVTDAEDGTNDEELLDAETAEVIDRDSPGRVALNVSFSAAPFSFGRQLDTSENAPPGLRGMKSSDCFNCHAVDQNRVGPKLTDIANKYRDQPDALDASVQRVLKGSTGVWGKIPMIPHSQHTVDELREMVAWIYSLKSESLTRVFNGFVGEINLPPEEAGKAGHYRLDAGYTDLGAGSVPPISVATTIALRSRLLEAELADEVNGPQRLNSGNASGGQFIGAVNHGHTLRFRSLNFDRAGQFTLRIASAGAGGAIELRADGPEGPLLGVIDVEVNGQWEEFYERTLVLRNPETGAPLVEGRHDLIVRFTHPQNAGGLMNLDSIHVRPPAAAAR